jgi:hypothetical protein
MLDDICFHFGSNPHRANRIGPLERFVQTAALLRAANLNLSLFESRDAPPGIQRAHRTSHL